MNSAPQINPAWDPHTLRGVADYLDRHTEHGRSAAKSVCDADAERPWWRRALRPTARVCVHTTLASAVGLRNLASKVETSLRAEGAAGTVLQRQADQVVASMRDSGMTTAEIRDSAEKVSAVLDGMVQAVAAAPAGTIFTPEFVVNMLRRSARTFQQISETLSHGHRDA